MDGLLGLSRGFRKLGWCIGVHSHAQGACCQIRQEAERQALAHASAEQGERERLARQSEQLVQSVQAHQATLHALQAQQTEHSAKRLPGPPGCAVLPARLPRSRSLFLDRETLHHLGTSA